MKQSIEKTNKIRGTEKDEYDEEEEAVKKAMRWKTIKIKQKRHYPKRKKLRK